jgi:hypothetical protein
MRKVKITTTMIVTDKFFEDEIIGMKNDILSGKFKRELVDSSGYSKDEKGIKKISVTFEEIDGKK